MKFYLFHHHFSQKKATLFILYKPKAVFLHKIHDKAMILIADSGSTKTAWALCDEKSHSIITIFQTQGINPYQQSEEDVCSIMTNELQPLISEQNVDAESITSIYFYGAGCTKEKSPIVATALRKTIASSARIYVESDMLGAARGLCGNQPGIVCILGTGSNSCYYDGHEIIANVSPLGFILGDEGSGAYIGKRLVGDILKHQMPQHICKLFLEETHETQATIIQKVYREQMPNRFLARLSTFCAKHRDEPAIQSFLIDCFTQFFKRNIEQYPTLVDDRTNLSTVYFIGSIAYYYRDELSIAAKECGFTVGKICQSPLEGLIDYHI